MSDLQSLELMQFEGLFDMKNGYVLGTTFTDNSFRQFIYDNTNIDINDDKYYINGKSKAKRLRAFINLENNHVVAKVLDKLIEVWVEEQLRINDVDNIDEIKDKSQLRTYKKCKEAINNLNGTPLNIEALEREEEDFSLLVSQIKISIDNGQIEGVLDRLHTYMMKFTRRLCNKHGRGFKSDEPLHSLFGKYIKCLKSDELIESEMTETILKCNISILEKFNDVRNDKSLAHDNIVLNRDESLFIFNNIVSLKSFIDSIEKM